LEVKALVRTAIYTLILRHYRLEEAVALAKELGYDAVEFTVGYKEAVWDGRSEWHLPLEGIESAVPEVRRTLDRYGMPLVCLSTGLGFRDLDQLRRVFWAASELGCPHIRVGTAPYDPKVGFWRQLSEVVEGWREVERLAKEFKVKALAELHHGLIVASASAMHMLVRNFDPQHVGVIFDPGNMVIEGREEWRKGMEILGDYLAHVHVKNAIMVRGKDGSWRPKWVGLDEGLADWRGIIRDLAEVGYEGALSVEDFRQIPGEEDPRKMERRRAEEDLSFLREALASVKGG